MTGAHGIPVVADALAQDVSFDEVEWLILPGGMPGMTNLAASRPLCDLVKAHAEAGGRTAAICARKFSGRMIVINNQSWVYALLFEEFVIKLPMEGG